MGRPDDHPETFREYEIQPSDFYCEDEQQDHQKGIVLNANCSGKCTFYNYAPSCRGIMLFKKGNWMYNYGLFNPHNVS